MLASAYSKAGDSKAALRAARDTLSFDNLDVDTLRRIGRVFTDEGLGR